MNFDDNQMQCQIKHLANKQLTSEISLSPVKPENICMDNRGKQL